MVPSGVFQALSESDSRTHWFGCHGVLLTRHLEPEAEVVDGNLELPGEVLGDAGQKGLGEVETGNPEHVRRTILDPVLHEQKQSAKRDNLSTNMECDLFSTPPRQGKCKGTSQKFKPVSCTPVNTNLQFSKLIKADQKESQAHKMTVSPKIWTEKMGFSHIPHTWAKAAVLTLFPLGKSRFFLSFPLHAYPDAFTHKLSLSLAWTEKEEVSP